MLKVGRGVIALAKIQLQTWAIDSNSDPSEAPVAGGVCASIPDHEIEGGVLLHTGKNTSKIIGVQEGSASCVAGERDQRLL